MPRRIIQGVSMVLVLAAAQVAVPGGAQQYQYDLGIRTQDIFFSKPANQLLAGDRVRVYGRIRNEGAEDVSGFLSFYQSNQLIGDSQVVSVRASGAEEEAWVDFTVPSTAFNIRAEIRGTSPADQNSANDTAVSPMFIPKVDSDADGIADAEDNCPAAANADQADADGDGKGNACDTDDDNDGLSDTAEEAQGTSPTNSDSDGDGVADNQDLYPNDPSRATAPPPAPPPPPPPAPSSEEPEPPAPSPGTQKPEAEPIANTPRAERAPTSTPEAPTVDESAFRITVPAIASALYRRKSWDTYEFEATKLDGVGDITVLWRFGDGETSAERRVIHRYRKPGTYLVALEVTDTSGTIAHDEVRIEISFFNPDNPKLWMLIGGILAVGAAGVLAARLLERRKSRRKKEKED